MIVVKYYNLLIFLVTDYRVTVNNNYILIRVLASAKMAPATSYTRINPQISPEISSSSSISKNSKSNGNLLKISSTTITASKRRRLISTSSENEDGDEKKHNLRSVRRIPQEQNKPQRQQKQDFESRSDGADSAENSTDTQNITTSSTAEFEFEQHPVKQHIKKTVHFVEQSSSDSKQYELINQLSSVPYISTQVQQVPSRQKKLSKYESLIITEEFKRPRYKVIIANTYVNFLFLKFNNAHPCPLNFC